MERDNFQENLLLYGADISNWPELLQPLAFKAMAENPAFLQLMLDEYEFESLAIQRSELLDDPSFAERIIIAARNQPKISWYKRFEIGLCDIIDALPFPKPTYALAAVVVVGLLIGISSQAEQNNSANSASILYEVRGMI